MADGQLAINTASASPGVFVKDSGGNLVKIGPVHVGSTAPNASPAPGGATGNSIGEIWLDNSGGNYVLKVWDGAAWRTEDNSYVNVTGDSMTGNLTLDASSLVFDTGTFNTTVTAATATAARTITVPDTTGTMVTTGDTGSVTSTMLANGTIVDEDISASAEIAVSKLADGAARQVLQTDAAGTGVEWTDNLDLPGTLSVTSTTTLKGDVTLNAQSDLRFADADSSNWVAFQAPTTVAANVTWTLPSADGSADQVLKTNGSGTLSWTTVTSGGGDVTLAGANAFTGANTFTNTTGQTFRQAATQDGILLRGRAGGTTSRTVEIVPAALTASRTLTAPDTSGTIITSNDSGTVTSAMIASGTIVDADISGTAAIADSKLATITTAGKVSGSAITSGTIGGTTIINTSGSIISGAISVGNISSSGNVSITGFLEVTAGTRTSPNLKIGGTGGSWIYGASSTIGFGSSTGLLGALLGFSVTNGFKVGSNTNGSFDITADDFADIGETNSFYKSGATVATFRRNTSDGTVISINQAGTEEGTISVSGTTVSYNGAHLSRWSQLPGGAERTEILRGTVLSNIDEMCSWGEEANEQLNRMKVSDVVGDPNVAGVFQAWDDDDDTYVDDFYCAMTGDFIIRIAEGVTVQRGDLLMSAGDGTATPQADDIIRSKTIAKVTSTNITCTYDDGSYCVPCVLMAC
jgi:hypothetical protein